MLDSYFTALKETVLAARQPGELPSIAIIRAGMKRETEALGRGPEVAQVKDHWIATRAGKILVRELRPENPRGILVHVHGGGWSAGTVEDFDSLGRALARQTRCSVLLPEYRLAPEHPFPAGLEDVEDALVWAHGSCMQQGLPLLCSGDSAGGNLVVSALLSLKDRVQPCHLTLAYPVTDACFETNSYKQHGTGQLFTAAAMRQFFESYAAPKDWADPRISVLGRSDLAGLPEVFVLTCGNDLLRDDGAQMATVLESAGVRVRHKEYATAPHGFLRQHAQSELARDALAEIGRVVAESLVSLGKDYAPVP